MEKTLTLCAQLPMAKAQDVAPWGGAPTFVRRYLADPDLQSDPALHQLHTALVSHASVCSFCGVGCPYTRVQGANGKETLIPLSDLGLCVKGETSLLTGGDQQRVAKLQHRARPGDRIRAPMIRGHDGRWTEVSWERALDRAAWLLLHIREWVGPEGVAIYGNGQQTIEAIWMASLYKLVFRIATMGANSEHCLSSAGAAHELNFGNEAAFTWQEFEELALCDVAVLHGTNPLVTFPQAYAKLTRNTTAVKVVIDPIESDTALDLLRTDPRTLHIRFAQGGDVLFNLAVARVILEHGWEDSDYLAQAVEPASLHELRDLCLQERCTPEAVAAQIALEGDDPTALAATIRRYAALIAQPRPDGERPRPAFVSSMGINQSTGSYGFSTNLNLLLLTGNVGRRGAGSLRIAGQSNATSELMLGFNSRRLLFNLDPANPEHRRELAQILDIPESNIPDHHGTPVSRMADDDYLYGFIFMGTQFTKNMPRLGHWLTRLGRSFCIVIDSFLPEGAMEYADVLLPALSYTERTGVIQRGDRTLQLQQALSPPPPMAWSDEQILARLALAIAARLHDPDTAALNNLDAAVIQRTFGRYIDTAGNVDAAQVFDHVVAVSQQLGVYNQSVDANGQPISHAMLQARAGLGVQWQGDGRYAEARTQGDVFPRLRHGNRGRARLVRPPDRFLAHMVTRGDDKLRSLITGRGRPGHNAKRYVARYNSGIKTLPITAPATHTYWIELHPTYAAGAGLQAGDPVRITSHHGTVIGCVSLNAHVPVEFPFFDFVPGEANRLTDYLDADRFTNQSLIKRTPVRIEPLSPYEAALWQQPEPQAFAAVIVLLSARYRSVYPTDEDADRFARGEPDAPEWFPRAELRTPAGVVQQQLAQALGAMATFLQRFADDADYRTLAAAMLQGLPRAVRDSFLTILLPLLRLLDYETLLLSMLSHVLGGLPLHEASGRVEVANLHDAHQHAVIEIKEEVVAVQIFVAIKHALEVLYGAGGPIPREDVALISGIRIPCASDVPAYFMGISPADLETSRLVHCHVIGGYALVVVDRRHNRAVKIDIATGVLPKDRELLRLRSKVIMNKRTAGRDEHRRFFDRLPELMVHFVRTGEDNFRVVGPVSLPWEEFAAKLAFVPAGRDEFCQYLERSQLSPALVQGLVDLEVLDGTQDADLIQRLLRESPALAPLTRLDDAYGSQTFAELLGNASLSPGQKVQEVIERFIAPVIHNDGGKLDLLGFDETTGKVTVRFAGSCTNCPASMLTVETLVKPPLLSIPGVYRVEHRLSLRSRELSGAAAFDHASDV